MKICRAILLIVLCLFSAACTDSAAQGTRQSPAAVADGQADGNGKKGEEIKMIGAQKDLGALSPEDALAYMQKTKNLLIVDAAAKRWYEQKTFAGAINVPVEELGDEELTEAVKKLPSGRPVLVHCRLGMVAPQVYRRIKEVRPDVPEIAWLDGKPLFDEYNEWVKNNQ